MAQSSQLSWRITIGIPCSTKKSNSIRDSSEAPANMATGKGLLSLEGERRMAAELPYVDGLIGSEGTPISRAGK